MIALWTERHQPASEADLVVSKKKVQEVREFLTQGWSLGRRLLVLRGPTGSGKAAVLRALCNDLGFEIAEWTVAVRGATGPGAPDGFREPLGDAFIRFLAQADRYSCLQPGLWNAGAAAVHRPRVTLVRDFPFTLLDARGDRMARGSEFLQRFHAAVSGGALQRTVFCFNDTREDWRAIAALFGPLNPGVVFTVSFDSVPRTFAQRALDMVAKTEGLDPVRANTAVIAAECGGDLRHGLNALQLAAGSSRQRLALKADIAGRGRRGARGPRPPTPQGGASSSALVDDGRTADEGGEMGLRLASLGLFHALGRLLYCKRIPPEVHIPAEAQPPAAKRRRRGAGDAEPRQLPHELLVPKASRPPLYFVPEDVLDSANAEPGAVVDWLFTNAPRFYGDVGDLAEFGAALAESDTWCTGLWQPGRSEAASSPAEALARSVQVRSLLDANLHPVPPSFADPCGAQQRSEPPGLGPAATFNMARPLMRDALRHQQRRLEELSTHLERISPEALGAAHAGPGFCLRTLPYVHLMLCFSRGSHPTLRCLPHPLMQVIKDLNEPIDCPCFVGGDGPASQRGNLSGSPSAMGTEPLATWGSALADDPIEGPDG